jgi:Zn-dependent peptidase ImmA (M78 family)
MATLNDITVQRRYEIYKTAVEAVQIINQSGSLGMFLEANHITLAVCNLSKHIHAISVLNKRLFLVAIGPNEEDRRFAASHELGHYFLHKSNKVLLRTSDIPEGTSLKNEVRNLLPNLQLYSPMFFSKTDKTRIENELNENIEKYGVSEDKTLEREANYFSAVMLAPTYYMLNNLHKTDDTIANELGIAKEVVAIRRSEVEIEQDYNFEAMHLFDKQVADGIIT